MACRYVVSKITVGFTGHPMVMIYTTHPQVDRHVRGIENQPGDTRTVVGGQLAGVDEIFPFELSFFWRSDFAAVILTMQIQILRFEGLSLGGTRNFPKPLYVNRRRKRPNKY